MNKKEKREKDRKYEREHVTEIRIRKHKYYLKNKETILKRTKKYRKKHKEWYRKYNKKYSFENKERLSEIGKKYYNQQLDIGMCIKGCGNKHCDGKTMCQECLNKKIRHVDILKKSNMCRQGCGRKTKLGTTYCLICLKKINELNRKRTIELKTLNLCITCGKKTSFNRSRCKKCLKKIYNSVQDYKKTPSGRIYMQVYLQNRRASKNKVVHSFTKEEWEEKVIRTKGYCCGCNKNKKRMSMDHIYPLRLAYRDFKETGIKRIYTIKDVFPVCRNCNSSKGSKLTTWK